MLVTINGVNQFSTYTWQDVLNLGTWQEVLPYTWYDIYVESNNILMESPTPEVDLSVDKRCTASFTILDIGATKHFKKGQEVEIYSSIGYKVFGGYIDSSSERLISGRDVIKHSISCADYHYLAEKRIVAKAWQDTTVETIVNYVLDQYLEAEGVILGEIQAGGTVTQYIANYISVADVLDNMAERAGFIWFIDEYKRLYFVDRTSYAAEWDLIETDDFLIEDAFSGVNVTHANPEYRNRQYIVGTWEETDIQTEYAKGDGQTTSFPVAYKLGGEPEVYVSVGGGDYTLKTIGKKGVDTGKDWYWAKNDQIISQDSSATALAETDVLKIIYTGLYQIVVVTSDFAEIIDRQTVEGAESSGIVENVRSDTSLSSRIAALEEANAILDVYAMEGKKVEYTTSKDGLAAGVLQHIKISKHDIDDDCLISNITFRYTNQQDYYDVVAYTGPIEDDWEDIFIKLSDIQKKMASPDDVNTSDVLLVLITFTKSWTAIESPNIWQVVYADGTEDASEAWLPCFEDSDRIKYLVLKKSGAEIFRMYRTDQTTTSDSIITTFIIPSGSANGEIDQAVLVGGDTATITPGTGIEVETHSFIYTKNSLESLQLQFTSNKWV